MLILFLSLWGIGALLLLMNGRQETIRWASYYCLASGCGGLSTVLGGWRGGWGGGLGEQGIAFAVGATAAIWLYLTPWTLLIFSMRFGQQAAPSMRFASGVKVVLFLPAAIMFVLYPIYPGFRPDYSTLTLWVAPYVLIANVLLVHQYLRESNVRQRRQKGLVCFLFVPKSLFSLLSNYILEDFHIRDVWRYNGWIVAAQLVCFLYFGYRYGVLGVRIKIERDRLDSVTRTVSSGMALLGHTIKNETAKLRLFGQRIQTYSESKDDPKLHDYAGYILDSVRHLESMMSQIQLHSREIELEKSTFSVRDWLDQLVKGQMPLFEQESIRLLADRGSTDWLLDADRAHLNEAAGNVLANAREAAAGGTVTIRIGERRGQLRLSIRDDGQGILPEYLSRVMEPFFSTKGRDKGFGLGLSYCRTVMRLHGGDVEIGSEWGKGTEVSFIFPRNAFIRMKSAEEHGHDSVAAGRG